MDSQSVVASFFTYWCVQDLEMAATHMHPEVVYVIHNGPDASPLAGVYRGIERVRELGYAALAEFDYLRYEPTIISADDEVVRARVVFVLRHRASGHNIDGSQRSMFEVRNGLITRVDIYEDALRIEAFMRLARGSAQWGAGLDLSYLQTGRQKSGAGA